MPAAQADGGGAISNVAPTIEEFESATAQAGQPSQFTGVASDRNGEADVVELRLERANLPPVLRVNHTVTAAELSANASPAAATDGWRVWNPVPKDGLLSWSYDWVPDQAGTHVWTLTTLDEALNSTEPLNVSVFPPAGGGGGGGGGDPGGSGSGAGGNGGPSGGTPPGPTDPGQPSQPANPNDGGQQGAGPDPLANRPRDLSLSLTLTVVNGQAVLIWDAVPGALGYQVWRHTSPWTLRAELPASDSAYAEPLPSLDAFYKVTFFTERTILGGWAPDGDRAPAIPGWSEDSAVKLEVADDGGDDARPGAGALLDPGDWNWTAVIIIGASLSSVVLLLLSLLRRGKGP